MVAVDVHALYRYLAEELGRLPILEIETAPILRTVKRAGAGNPVGNPAVGHAGPVPPGAASPAIPQTATSE